MYFGVPDGIATIRLFKTGEERMIAKICLLLLCAALMPVMAVAQPFSAQTLTREIHVIKSEEGDTRVILRTPLMLVFANELAARKADNRIDAPFIKNDVEDGSNILRLDSAAILDDYDSFAQLLMRDYRFSVGGKTIEPDMLEYVVIDSHDLGDVNVNIGLGFTSSSSMLSLCTSDYPDQPKISETIIVISFYLNDVMPDDAIKIELNAASFVPLKGAEFETRITDFRADRADVIVQKGTGFDPVTLYGAAWPWRNLLGQYWVWLGLAMAALIGAGVVWRKSGGFTARD